MKYLSLKRLPLLLCTSVVVGTYCCLIGVFDKHISLKTDRIIKSDRYYAKTNKIERSHTLVGAEQDIGSTIVIEAHTSNDVHDNDANRQTEFNCAQWIPIEKRKIVMTSALNRFVTWEDHLKGIIKGGEPYWSACIHYVLLELGFEVTVQNKKLDPVGGTMQQLERGEIHRIITDSSTGVNFVSTTSSIWDMPELLCKVRMMVW